MLRKLSQTIFAIGISIIGLSLPLLGHAQLGEFQLYTADDINADIFPEIPGPNESVDIKLTSYSFNLNNYYIAWFENGQQRLSGYGEREYTFGTGESGTITEVTAVIEFEDQVFRKEFRFSPSQIDLLWEVTDGYTPPFYKGKALPVLQSEIRVTAIPETLLIEPTDAPNLVYYWDNNFQRKSSRSGFGRQSFSFTADPLNVNEKVTVTSNDRRENSFASATIDIPTTQYESKILFYEIDGDNRIKTNKALNTNNIVGKDSIRFGFYPLHFSSVKKNFVDLFVNWSINNEPNDPQDFDKQNEINISSGGDTGTADINVKLENIEKILQNVEETVSLIFN